MITAPLIILLTFILGTLVGSFLNVVTLRYGTDKPTIGGRSQCMVCERELTWYELVPIASFVILRGRCRTCDTPLNSQYPLVELITGVLFTLVLWSFGLTLTTIIGFIVVSLLMIIAVYDLRHLIIPDPFVWAFNAVAFLTTFINFSIYPPTFSIPSILALLSGPIMASPFLILWLISRGRWMGLGDAKLALGIGWLLYPLGGLSAGASAIVIGFWAGAAVSLILLGWSWMSQNISSTFVEKLPWGKADLVLGSEGLTIKSAIPFGPFLIFGILITYLFSISIFFL